MARAFQFNFGCIFVSRLGLFWIHWEAEAKEGAFELERVPAIRLATVIFLSFDFVAILKLANHVATEAHRGSSLRIFCLLSDQEHVGYLTIEKSGFSILMIRKLSDVCKSGLSDCTKQGYSLS